ncbi:hypothetical protein LO772_32500 [Yinghuangia sp. ASG 101]|uniref:hypothetical protein n=1 Tax=Yinghuangia sp. ASG 101 TaxID=2896848 RepID=UPI001E574D3F|nr:hypothetical protein [Yinghuangia sp. ASG 101]UGQ11459.1 hypothetical protein LO772_32500 [Yinghuangia sp. ASG 101]
MQDRFVERVRRVRTELVDDAAAPLDPRVHHGWWVLIDVAARRAELEAHVIRNSGTVVELVRRGEGELAEPRLRLIAFYLIWQVFRRNGLVGEQYALLEAVEQRTATQHALEACGGETLRGAFLALLRANEIHTSREDLEAAYADASAMARLFPNLVGFTRLRRSVGLALLSHESVHGDAEGGAVQRVMHDVRADFLAERDADPRWMTPQLRAEALSAEAQFHCLPMCADYAQAVQLVTEAKRVDRKTDGENAAAFHARLVRYDQQLLLIGSLRQVGMVRDELESRLDRHAADVESRMTTALEAARRDSVQILGLLAAVIALITAFAGNSAGSTLGASLLSVLATSGVVVMALSAFAVLFQTRRSSHRWMAFGLGAALIAAAFAVFLWAPSADRFGDSHDERAPISETHSESPTAGNG